MSKIKPAPDTGPTLTEFSHRATLTSDVLRALSHEHRLMILSLLAGRERSVGELEQILRLPQPAVSQQLARLRLDDLVTSRRSGRTIYYTAELPKIDALYRDLGALLGRMPDASVSAHRVDAEIAAGLSMPMTEGQVVGLDSKLPQAIHASA